MRRASSKFRGAGQWPPAKEVKPTLVDQAKEKLEEVQHQLDERIKSILATFRPFQQMQQELRRLNERVEELERKLKGDPPATG